MARYALNADQLLEVIEDEAARWRALKRQGKTTAAASVRVTLGLLIDLCEQLQQREEGARG